MFARKIQLFVLLVLSLGMLAPFAPLFVQTARAAQPANEVYMQGPSGGGGGGQLTQAEIEGLLYMREEEKMARDVYLTLYNKWRLAIFTTISSSEVTHMTRIKDLLDRYGLADPAAGKPVGVFTNPVIQQLYNDLILRGSQSSTEALRVGVTIEEVDISDLQRHLALTNKNDITNVYTNLKSASYNHLRAFKTQLGQ